MFTPYLAHLASPNFHKAYGVYMLIIKVLWTLSFRPYPLDIKYQVPIVACEHSFYVFYL